MRIIGVLTLVFSALGLVVAALGLVLAYSRDRLKLAIVIRSLLVQERDSFGQLNERNARSEDIAGNKLLCKVELRNESAFTITIKDIGWAMVPAWGGFTNPDMGQIGAHSSMEFSIPLPKDIRQRVYAQTADGHCTEGGTVKKLVRTIKPMSDAEMQAYLASNS